MTDSEASADRRDVEAKRFANGDEREWPAGVIRGEPSLDLGELAASPPIGPGRGRLVLAESTLKDRDHQTFRREKRIGLRLKTELFRQDRRLGRYWDEHLEASHGVGRMARPRERRESLTLLRALTIVRPQDGVEAWAVVSRPSTLVTTCSIEAAASTRSSTHVSSIPLPNSAPNAPSNVSRMTPLSRSRWKYRPLKYRLMNSRGDKWPGAELNRRHRDFQSSRKYWNDAALTLHPSRSR